MNQLFALAIVADRGIEPKAYTSLSLLSPNDF